MESPDIHGRYTIDDVGRLYEVGDEQWLPSVSTVLDMRKTPEALKRWKERTDNYEEIMSYKQNRGTLIHAECQMPLVPEGPDSGEPIKQIWGEDEEESVEELKAHGEYERYQEDLEWAMDAWDMIQLVCNFDTVLDVETYVANTDIGYAGQFDLLYQDEEAGETVLADLKTSKYVYDKHQLQLSAYEMAVPMAIDRMEVIRLNPDKKDWFVSSSHDWNTPIEEMQSEFIRLRGELEQQKLKTIVDTIGSFDKSDDGVMYEEMG